MVSAPESELKALARAPAVTLHAPRDVAIAGDTLYVVDLAAVRLLDRLTGAPKASWPITDARFPNDVRVDVQGKRRTSKGYRI